jgi:hypothetical protein
MGVVAACELGAAQLDRPFGLTDGKRAWRVSVESTGMFNHESARGERNGAGRFEAFEAPTITSPTFAADADTFTARS